ncbi:MAG: type II secretion system protein [Magnetococcales bacterium]|nr:type II secretion system protein [Magnetococcales bacterium]NGZ27416.1 type II secretion system protein [Magnetococcales bacterium]
MSLTCRLPNQKQKGFSLIELSIVMIVIGIILSIMANLAPTFILSGKDKANRAILNQYQFALRGYLASHNYLPCPDTNNDGVADVPCANTGTVPFVDLGMPNSNGRDAFDNPVRYGVYRGTDEDLTETTNSRNRACGILRRMAATAGNTAFVYVGGSNIPFGLASGGRDNAFTVNNSGTQFAANDEPLSATYDDMTASDSFNELYTVLNCGPDETRLKIVAPSTSVTWKNTATNTLLNFDVVGGVAPYRWCITSSGLKPGNVTMDPNDWTELTTGTCTPTTSGANDWLQLSCSGTCTSTPTPGDYPIRIFVMDSKDETANVSLFLTIQ